MKRTASWPSASSPRLAILGNPANRRVLDFQQAVEDLGAPRPPCLSWIEFLSNPASLDALDADLLRIDSPGEDDAVTRALIHLGGGPSDAPLAFGEIAWLREQHQGFLIALDQIRQDGIACLNAPADIGVMFDKWASHQRFAAAGIPRPASAPAPDSFAELREQMRARPNGRWFLKPFHGSSASGVCALQWTAARTRLTAPLRIRSEHGRTFLANSLRVQSYDSTDEVAWILDRLLPQGMIREDWVPKLTLPGGAIDLRVLVLASEPRHRVVRQSRHPMTNLHLGNRRADESALTEAIGPDAFHRALDLARLAAATFPDSLYAGVDVLIDAHHRPRIGEINAFGDLLPRLLDRGQSAYAAIAHACLAPRHLL
jgi:hypothetical protein